MPTPDAPEPLDPAPSPAAPSAAAPTEATPGGGRDLAAIPAFLRRRASGTMDSAVHAPIRRPDPAPAPDIASLPMLGIAPRRLVLIGAMILLAWVVVSFGRQVAEASASSMRAEEMRAANAALTNEVAALERELEIIQDQRYIGQAARAFRLGTPGEIPFALQAGAPSLPPDAPGSAAVSLGAGTSQRSPVDSWLDLLFGPGD